jgi:mannose-6-phosphate isomerase-like protein (cupin superfamily)
MLHHKLETVFSQLSQDVKSDIQMLKLTDGAMALFAAKLKAGKMLPAHYHRVGSEVYQILDGDGIFELGQWDGLKVVWSDRLPVRAGDIFEVQPGWVHLLSGGGEDLRMIFFAPPSHLGDDRCFIESETTPVLPLSVPGGDNENGKS